MGFGQSDGSGLPQRFLLPANEVAGKLESEIGILPERRLPETLRSVIEIEDRSLELRVPVKELNSSLRVSRWGS